MHHELLHFVLTGPLMQKGDTALHVASGFGQIDVVQVLITRGATVDIQNKVRLNL